MLQAHLISRSYGAETVLDGVSFVANRGERLVIAGPNGSGKTTLMRILAGLDRPDRGSVSLDPGATRAYLAQDFDLVREGTLEDALAAADGGLRAAERELEAASDALAAGIPGSGERYETALAAFEARGGYERLARSAAALTGLGLSAVDATTSVATLSGGQKTRLGLACLLLQEPDVLLLDEPTNHLDISAQAWLERYLLAFPGAVIVVSHDRAFVDAVATAVLWLDAETRRLTRYEGGYSAFLEQRAAERDRQEQRWKEQQEYATKVKGDIARLKGEALAIERSTTPRQPGVRRHARRKAAVAKSREKKLERYLAADDRVERPKQAWEVHLDLGSTGSTGRDLVRVEELEVAYPGFPPLLTGVTFDVLHGDRVAIVGDNGSGKTSLLRVLDGRLEPTAGRLWWSPSARRGFLAQEQESLDPERTVLETILRAAPMSEGDGRTFLHQFLFKGDAALRRVGLCSQGERARLQLAGLVAKGCNVLLLDEPLNHLDVSSREQFEEALDAFDGAVLAVAHDRTFLSRFAERVLHVEGGSTRMVEGGYAP